MAPKQAPQPTCRRKDSDLDHECECREPKQESAFETRAKHHEEYHYRERFKSKLTSADVLPGLAVLSMRIKTLDIKLSMHAQCSLYVLSGRLLGRLIRMRRTGRSRVLNGSMGGVGGTGRSRCIACKTRRHVLEQIHRHSQPM